jgi:hypothetical protein
MLSFDWSTNSIKGTYSGTYNALTKLSFKAKSGVTGTTKISFKFLDEGVTSDSNLVYKPANADPEDILAKPTATVTVNFVSPPTETPTPIPTCSMPRPGITATCNSNYRNDLRCSWSGVNDATEYRGQIDNDSNFSSPLVNTTGSSTSRSIGNVTANTTYYCRSKVTKSNGSCTAPSSWSSTVTVKKACPTPTPTVTNTPTPTNTPAPTEKPTDTPVPTNEPTTTPQEVTGDANGDGLVDIEDYKVWVNNYNSSTQGGSNNADFNNDDKVDGKDYIIWLRNYGA